jgi:hypothetical protein
MSEELPNVFGNRVRSTYSFLADSVDFMLSVEFLET